MDSWEDAEDEDFKPTIPVVAVADNWEDEEDQTLIEQQAALAAMAIRAPLTPAQIEAQKKKEELEEQRLQNQIKYAKLENETSEQRVIRERKQVEDADAALAEELFDVPAGAKRSVSSSSSGLASLNLKNKEDHINFGIMAAQKMSDSTSFCITAFLKEVLNRNGAALSAESLTDLATTIQVWLSLSLDSHGGIRNSKPQRRWPMI
jgi:hypothetical protein